jgi:hypothetical protein
MRIAVMLVLLTFSGGAFAQDESSPLWERGLLADSIMFTPGLMCRGGRVCKDGNDGEDAERKRQVELWLGKIPKISEVQSHCEQPILGGWRSFITESAQLVQYIEQRRDQFHLWQKARPIIAVLLATRECAVKAVAKEVADAIKMSAIFAGGN